MSDDFEIRVVNNNLSTANLIESYLEWPGPASPPSNTQGQPYVNYLRMSPETYFETNIYYSPLTVGVSTSGSTLPAPLDALDDATWEADFDNGLLQR